MRSFITAAVALGTLTTATIATRGDDAPAKAIFDRLDANHDSQISPDEVPAEQARLFQRLLRVADKDSSGTLSAEEFVSGLAERRPERPFEEKSPGSLGGPAGLPDPEVMFKRLDKNQDGKIVLDEVPDEGRDRFEQLLARADKNGDMALTQEELTEGINSFAKDIQAGFEQARDPKQILKYLDANGDGKLTPNEVPEERRENFTKLFARFDKDDDKALNEEEFTAAIRFVQQMRGDLKPDAPAKPAESAPASSTPSSSAPSTSTPNADAPKTDSLSKPATPASPEDRKAARLKRLNGAGIDPARMTQRLMRMDKDQDGKVSREEFSGRPQMFERIDANHDGYLEAAEIQAGAEKLKARMEQAKAGNS